MRIKAYLRDKMAAILIFLFLLIVLTGLQLAFKVNSSCIVVELVVTVTAFMCVFIMDYYRRSQFYKEFVFKLDNLDQKYLITEILGEPHFEEGRILKESLYEIDKSMKEKINYLKNNNDEFKEYLEMWVHEIKLPLSALTLMNYNGNVTVEKQKVLIRKMEHYVEQILFMSRADAAEKDYLLRKCRLETNVNKALIANKDILIESKIAVEKQNLDMEIVTDSKWLEFVLGQLISNSVKYSKPAKGKIKFWAFEKVENNKKILVVEDNGIGVSENDISNVFKKSFTGQNGRKVSASTGMGLYICNKLLTKMGHNIWMESEEGEYTRVYIEFGNETYYTM